MNKKLYAYLERGADFVDRPVLSWAHIAKWDDAPVVWTANGYAVHMVWGMPYMTGQSFPFSRSMFYDDHSQMELPKPPNTVDIAKSSVTDIVYNVDSWLLKRLLTACKTNKHFDNAYLLSHNSGLYLASDSGVSYLGFGEAPDGLLSFSVQFALSALIDDGVAEVNLGWSSTDRLIPYRLGLPGYACAYIMPTTPSSDAAHYKKVWQRYSRIAKAMEVSEGL